MAELEDEMADRLLDEQIQREKDELLSELREKVSNYEYVLSCYQDMLVSDNENVIDCFSSLIECLGNYQKSKFYSKLSVEELYKILKNE